MLLGLVFFLLGAALTALWLPELVIVFKGGLILSLFLWGAVAFLIGLSRRKARRDYARALHDEPGEDFDEGPDKP